MARPDWRAVPPSVVIPEPGLKSGDPGSRGHQVRALAQDLEWDRAECPAPGWPRGPGVSLGVSMNLSFSHLSSGHGPGTVAQWGEGREPDLQPVGSKASIPVGTTEGFPGKRETNRLTDVYIMNTLGPWAGKSEREEEMGG